jgi:hypothetical protein
VLSYEDEGYTPLFNIHELPLMAPFPLLSCRRMGTTAPQTSWSTTACMAGKLKIKCTSCTLLQLPQHLPQATYQKIRLQLPYNQQQTAARVKPSLQTCGGLIGIFMCVHKNIKISNPSQPFTGEHRRHVTLVVKSLRLTGSFVPYDVTD